MVAWSLRETGKNMKPGDLVTPGSVIDVQHSHVGWYYTWVLEMCPGGQFFAARRSSDKFKVGEVGLVIATVQDANETYVCVITPRGIPGYISINVIGEVS